MKFKLKTLTPVKIGTGEVQEINQFNSFVYDDKLVVFDIERLLSSNLEKMDGIFKGIKSDGSLGSYFNDKIKSNEDYWKYSVPIKDKGTVNEIENSGEVEPQIMLPDNTFYIPGSSVKGSLRTNILTKYYLDNPTKWHGKGGRLETPDSYLQIGRNDPKRDIMKAFQVTDTDEKRPLESGIGLSVKTYSKKKGGKLQPKHWTTAHLAIDEKQEFEFEISINEKLLKKMKDEWRGGHEIDRILGGTDEEDVIDHIFESCKEVSRKRLEKEDKFLRNLSNSHEFNSLNFLVEDLKYELDDDCCLFNLGFGIGRLGTTVQLSAIQDEVKKTLRKMSGVKGEQQNKLSIDYPKSRKYYLNEGNPEGMLGWVKLERS